MTQPQPRPPRITGVRHFFAAMGYSLSGARRLWAEDAFRQEMIGGVSMLIVLALLDASGAEFAAFGALFAILVAVEALNTALECVVDHLSPDWSEFARDAKDLGSLAVMCVLLAHGVLLAHVAWGAFFG
ncbi:MULTISPECIES: diacylglycerol kinase [Sediminimonas]|uniref:diacylglycerol kinase n=1 Tax=Sediminimonas TaxID=659427 RepID=UPI0003FAB7C3|nr:MULTISPECIES: diacylglycerol kinase [Sediminimonas]MDR9483560.1 diacylglycerol kinase [Sediminimonas sp.]